MRSPPTCCHGPGDTARPQAFQLISAGGCGHWELCPSPPQPLGSPCHGHPPLHRSGISLGSLSFDSSQQPYMAPGK